MSQTHKNLMTEQWADIEAHAYDRHYKGALPFGKDGLQFTIEEALRYCDYSFKPSRARWGHRTRKFLEFVDLDSLSGKHVLDVGSGVGQLCVLYALAGATVTGVELSSTGTEIAKETAAANGVSDQCNFLAGEFTTIDMADDSYDVVTLHTTLHHLIKYPNLKEKIFRITKQGGTIVVCDTVQGSILLHSFRKLIKTIAYLRKGRKQHEEDLGDVLFNLETYHAFAEGAESYVIHTMDFFYMINKVFGRLRTKSLPSRLILRMVKMMDDVVIHLFPPIKNKLGGAVMRITK